MFHFSTYLNTINTLNPIVRLFIVSESFFWGAWSTIMPILSVFFITQVKGASIESATIGYSLYLTFRVIGSLTGAKLFNRASEFRKIHAVMFGITLVNVSYLGFMFFRTIPSLMMIYALIGLGVGIASPIRSAFFSKHLDKDRETVDWAMLESIIIATTAVAVIISGQIISHLGYNFLFIFAFIFNFFSLIPYIIVTHWFLHKDTEKGN